MVSHFSIVSTHFVHECILFTIIFSVEGDVNGIATVLSMTKGKEVRIVGRIPNSIKRNDTLNKLVDP